jgi:hypothetical protein
MKKLLLIVASFCVVIVLYSIIFADAPSTICMQGRITTNEMERIYLVKVLFHFNLAMG